MLNFFDKVIELLELLWGMIVNLVNGLISFIDLLLQVPFVAESTIYYLPPVIFSGIAAFIAISFIKVLVGR